MSHLARARLDSLEVLSNGDNCDPVNLSDVIKNNSGALAGVAQWIEYQPANQMVAGSIPSQGTCLGCRPGPQ